MSIRVTRLGDFLPIRLLLMIFWKDEVAQWNSNILRYFLLKIFYILTLNKQFQSRVSCRYCRVLKVVSWRSFGIFKLSFVVDVLAILATFSKIWANFPQSPGHPDVNGPNAACYPIPSHLCLLSEEPTNVVKCMDDSCCMLFWFRFKILLLKWPKRILS